MNVRFSNFKTGDIIEIDFSKGKISDESNNALSSFDIRPKTLLDEVRAGGRVSLIIGKGLTEKIKKYIRSWSNKNLYRVNKQRTKKTWFYISPEDGWQGLWC